MRSGRGSKDSKKWYVLDSISKIHHSVYWEDLLRDPFMKELDSMFWVTSWMVLISHLFSSLIHLTTNSSGSESLKVICWTTLSSLFMV